MSALALLVFAHARAHASRRSLAAWSLASVLVVATHYYGVLAVAPQAVWLAVAHRRLLRARLAVVVVGLCGAALVPLALSQNAGGHDDWISHSPHGLRLGQIIPSS